MGEDDAVKPEMLVNAVRAAVIDLERVAEEARIAAERARDRLTRLVLEIEDDD